MNLRTSIHSENKEIKLTLNKASFLRFVSAIGLVSKEAEKSARISLSQYRKGEYKVLRNSKNLLG